jgi:hypothetical protein
MRLLREKFFTDPLELLDDPLDLLPRAGALWIIPLHGRPARQPPMSAVHNRGHHLQIAHQLGASPGRGFLLSLRFEKQRGIIQNALPDRSRSSSPGGI